MESNNKMCAPGYPVSGARGAFTAVHQVETVAFQRARAAITVTKPIADLPPDLSAKTSELRT